MPVEIEKDWFVVKGDRILHHGESKPDCKRWVDKKGRGEVIAAPTNANGVFF